MTDINSINYYNLGIFGSATNPTLKRKLSLILTRLINRAMDTKDITKGSFYGYIKNQRKEFVKEVINIPQSKETLKLRTECDSLLIAYDQMKDRIVELERALQKILNQAEMEKDKFLPINADIVYEYAYSALNNKQK